MTPEPPSYRYAYHVALDGNGVNGLEGMAGVCLFLYDPDGDRYAWKVKFYDGVGAGHAVALNPDSGLGFLGNAGQHLLLYDLATLDEVGRQSTLALECPRSSVQGSTHLVWTGPRRFVTAIGEHYYEIDADRMDAAERLMPHGLKLPHAMKRSASGRYIVTGSMDQPADGRDGEAKHVGIWTVDTGEIRVVDLPATCWHLVASPTEDLAYAISFRVAPQDGHDY
jgi:hypothetical protein